MLLRRRVHRVVLAAGQLAQPHAEVARDLYVGTYVVLGTVDIRFYIVLDNLVGFLSKVFPPVLQQLNVDCTTSWEKKAKSTF